ncbi:emp24/gp25L/p24 family GOLD domain-containing protein [Helicosporidium sp. ATCC 50920]|nr:emp24/gp25L/p24 family GOLD domain-containing protein [Helicosporidium sp. ATCC 50920]|eukprot:KDD77193.1 emp24/gp25L/p24 family GOLD domain-containing protein [Helicosporidium sp. ATCC 50920]
MNDGGHTAAQIEDPAGVVIYENKAAPTGHFTFVSGDSEGEYKLCFTARDYPTAQIVRINMDWRVGASAHDWERVAKKDNLNFIETEILKLEALVHEIHMELQTIRRREETMRDITEATNARVAHFSIGVLLVCVGLAGWQLYYLQRFFKRKKIL